ncbi:phage tail assembly chaperone [Crenobacter cavernae]|uniref:Phage tail assembly protein n=1 Tax=Crenobacter cavernae TaxID=2290923 RepID=A0ABY0FAU9_9NEIS|nr:phage tail assembly chaperone [Crenobacter cavernae]RXZ42711.1 hypothetical protein EBB06_12520 [Crenobacter cavernae]
MANAPFSLVAAPTFKAKAAIPVPGAAPAEVEFTFKHRTREDLTEFSKGLVGREDVDVILDVASGWELTDDFGAESIKTLTQNYHGSVRAILDTYYRELTAARLGN